MSYTYANNQVIDQHTGGQSASKYFYINNRLGSVRQVIDMYGSVERNYTYSPFGQLLESGAAENPPSNPFMFTGQWFDDEISQYYLRARMYDPVLMRFTARDPVFGKFKEPMTLHKYLYCLNDPMNRTDPAGALSLGGLTGCSALRAGAFNALLSATRGGSAEDIVLSGFAGVFGNLAAGQVSAWLSTSGAFGTLLGPYAKTAYKAVGTSVGGMLATTIAHSRKERDGRFLADVFASGTLNLVWGGLAGSPNQGAIADLYDDTVQFFAFWLWDKYADRGIGPD